MSLHAVAGRLIDAIVAMILVALVSPVVEDEAMVREVTREILEGAGYQVLEAVRPDDAVRIARQHSGPLGLLLTDVVMPDGSGPALAQSLTLLHPEMRILYMSGYAENAADRDGLLDSGATFISKPFTPRSLLTKLRETLRASAP